MMGGMGRTFDGGYAEYTCVPASQVIGFTSELDWATLGAVPEMLQTSHGSLTIGLAAQPGQSRSKLEEPQFLSIVASISTRSKRLMPTWSPVERLASLS